MIKMRNCFVLFVGTVFAITALMKLYGILRGAVGTGGHDPVFPSFSVGSTMAIAAVLELACAYVCFFNRNSKAQLYSILWLSMIFVSYRFCLWLMGQNPECPCLGYLRVGGPQISKLIFAGLGWFVMTSLIGSCLLILEAAYKDNRPRAAIR
jgi:hypothetical protein